MWAAMPMLRILVRSRAMLAPIVASACSRELARAICHQKQNPGHFGPWADRSNTPVGWCWFEAQFGVGLMPRSLGGFNRHEPLIRLDLHVRSWSELLSDIVCTRHDETKFAVIELTTRQLGGVIYSRLKRRQAR